MLLADSGGSPGSGVEASVAAGTSLGAGTSTGEGAGSVISDGAEAENVVAGAGSAGEVGNIGSVGGTGGPMIGNASKDSSVAVGTSDTVALNGVVGAHGDSSKMGAWQMGA